MHNGDLIEDFRLLLQDELRSAVAMGLFMIALSIVYFVDASLLHDRLKSQYGIQQQKNSAS